MREDILYDFVMQVQLKAEFTHGIKSKDTYSF